LYQTSLKTANGCDSLVNLTLKLVELETKVKQTDEYLYAPEGNDSHKWIFCDEPGSCENLNAGYQKFIAPHYSGTYLLVIQKDVCVDTVIFNFNGNECKQPFFIPNSFTPNGDGINDVFLVEKSSCPTEQVELTIYDRWGREVHQASNLMLEWDGMLNGKLVSSGAYTYQLRYSIYENELVKSNILTGHISVLR
jgi:gliding motility-associated-like protein